MFFHPIAGGKARKASARPYRDTGSSSATMAPMASFADLRHSIRSPAGSAQTGILRTFLAHAVSLTTPGVPVSTRFLKRPAVTAAFPALKGRKHAVPRRKHKIRARWIRHPLPSPPSTGNTVSPRNQGKHRWAVYSIGRAGRCSLLSPTAYRGYKPMASTKTAWAIAPPAHITLRPRRPSRCLSA